MSRSSLCQSKQAYATALLARQSRDRRQRFERMRLYAYKCQACDWYHITKTKPPRENIV
jgi:hypothetical protein